MKFENELQVQCNDRIVSLDGLRGLAVLSVLVGHCLPIVGWFGHIGVTVFFALSGYVVAGAVDRAKRLNQSVFNVYLNRFARILPGVALMCLLSLLTVPNFSHDISSILEFHYNYLLVEGKTSIPTPVQMWSVCVEMHFYAIFIGVMWFVKNKYLYPIVTVLGFFLLIKSHFLAIDMWDADYAAYLYYGSLYNFAPILLEIS